MANGATDGGRGLSNRARMRRKDYEAFVADVLQAMNLVPLPMAAQ